MSDHKSKIGLWNSLKTNCEQWLQQGVLCPYCGQMPQALYTSKCTHVFCEQCVELCFGKRCLFCDFPINDRSVLKEETVYEPIIECAKQLASIVRVDLRKIGHDLTQKRQNAETLNENDENVDKIDEAIKKPEAKRKRTANGRYAKRSEDRKEFVSPEKKVKSNAKSKSHKNDSVFSKIPIHTYSKDARDSKLQSKQSILFDKTIKNTEVESEQSSEDDETYDYKDEYKTKRTKVQKIYQKNATKNVQASNNIRSNDAKRKAEDLEFSDNDEDENDGEIASKGKRSYRRNVNRKQESEKAKIVKIKKSKSSAKQFNNENNSDEEESEHDDLDEITESKVINKNRFKRSKKSSNDIESHDSHIHTEKRKGRPPKEAKNKRSLSFSAERSSSGKRLIIVTSGLNPEQTSIVSQFRHRFNCKLLSEYSEDVTHIICRVKDDNFTKRTIKYLYGVLGNKWIVSFDWIEDSLRKNELLNEELYELDGTKQIDNKVFTGIPKRSRTTKKKLFEGYQAFFEGKFQNSDAPLKNDLMALFTCGGGTVLTNNYQLNSAMKRSGRLFLIRDIDTNSSKATSQFKPISVADYLNMIAEFSIPSAFVNEL
ncbi:breast cancer 1-like protein [Dinothrombium tinctorium]|uniref:Breast cancer 1-like protein n=1 Tax=Dinothrombium tinctorium TaxID=1965070 RepID=A0A443RDM1_9ACAR|nr:breast cancer 1-like protein [Dinothrombium tinctorium]